MSIVSAAVQSVIEKLRGAMIEEAGSFRPGVREQAELITEEFMRMRALLRYDFRATDGRRLSHDRQNLWDRSLLNIAYEAEDAIDNFASNIGPRRRRGFRNIVSSFIASRKLGAALERIRIKMDAVKNRASDYLGIHEYGDDRATSGGHDQSSVTDHTFSLDAQEPDFVGFHQELELLIQLLTSGETRLRVASIVGMGGLGKTTLAQKAFNDDGVRTHFDLRAWVFVSQQFSVRELLQAVGKQCFMSFVEHMDRMSEEQLMAEISVSLRGKRYLIVLDDMWHYDAWDALRYAFPDENNGSRFLLTTRNRDVALYADPISGPLELRLLKDEESWELFFRKAFPGQEVGCPPHLEPIRKEIVKNCQGLPMAIVLMGKLLSRKEDREWEAVLRSIRWQLSEGLVPIVGILSQSYDDLPYSMKPCFLYLGIFPEDYVFSAHILIQLWAAEGFLLEQEFETLEEGGEDILMGLIERNMIQVTERTSSGRIQSCRIYSILWNLCIQKAKEDKFLVVDRWTDPLSCKGRRLSCHQDASNYAHLDSFPPHLRSVFLFNKKEGQVLERSPEKFLFGGRLKFLRVLNLEKVEVRAMPGEIGNLVHLRYIRCTDASIKSLPSSMANLHKLQTLYVWNTSNEGSLHIPSAVGQMLQQLRHLKLITTYEGFGLGGNSRSNPFFSKNFLEIIPNAMAYYEEAVTLANRVESHRVSELYHIDRNSMSNPARPLSSLLISRTFELMGKLKKLPQHCDFPSNLSKLILHDSSLSEDPLPLLEKLENLRFLELRYNSFIGKTMACSADGFPQLQSLHLVMLPNLEEWTVEEESMPRLSLLQIFECEQLKAIPEGLQHVTTLETLELWAMPQRFDDRVRPNIGEDWQKIRHITTIDIR
ncbi:hypothetical protein ACLOJK_039943 [Asimina triloba]